MLEGKIIFVTGVLQNLRRSFLGASNTQGGDHGWVRGQGLSFFKECSFRVRIRLGLGLVSTLTLTITLKQHSLKNKNKNDRPRPRVLLTPQFFWQPGKRVSNKRAKKAANTWFSFARSLDLCLTALHCTGLSAALTCA